MGYCHMHPNLWEIYNLWKSVTACDKSTTWENPLLLLTISCGLCQKKQTIKTSDKYPTMNCNKPNCNYTSDNPAEKSYYHLGHINYANDKSATICYIPALTSYNTFWIDVINTVIIHCILHISLTYLIWYNNLLNHVRKL